MIMLVARAMAMIVAMVVVMVVAVVMSVAMTVPGLGRRDLQHIMRVLTVMMVMIVAAAAIGTMHMFIMRVMIVRMMVVVIMTLMRMPMMVVRVMRMRGVFMPMPSGVGALLRPERAHHPRRRAALPAHHLGKDMVVLNVDGAVRDLGWRVAVADMPGHAHEPERVLGADFQQLLRGGLHGDEPAIIELQRIALVEHARLVEIHHQIQPAIAFQNGPAALTILMVQRDGVDHAIGLYGRFANDGGSAEHGSDPDGNDVGLHLSTCRWRRKGHASLQAPSRSISAGMSGSSAGGIASPRNFPGLIHCIACPSRD